MRSLKRQQHIHAIQAALLRGEHEIAKLFSGSNIGDSTAIEVFDSGYHEMLRKQKARQEMLNRLRKEDT